MIDLARMLREARHKAGLSQRELALRARTSGPTVAAYESGRVEPRLSTMQRLMAAAGQRLRVHAEGWPTPLTREERRSLFLHQLIAQKALARPAQVLEHARRNLRIMRGADTGGRAAPWLEEWERLLSSKDPQAVVAVLTDPHDPRARDLRQNTPFAGVLSPRERWERYRQLREVER